MKRLAGKIGGVDNQRQPRMPRRIYTSREDGIILHVDFPNLPIIVDDGSSMSLSCMELHALRVILLIVMAIDTLACGFCSTKHVIDHHLLVVVLQATLIQCQLLVGHIRRRYQAVAQVRVDAVLRHADFERLVAAPLSVVAGKHFYVNVTACCLTHQLAPIGHLGLNGIAAAHQLLTIGTETGHYLVTPAVPFKRQRSNVHRNGHIKVVGVYLRRFVGIGKRCRHFHMMATRQHGHHQCPNII